MCKLKLIEQTDTEIKFEDAEGKRVTRKVRGQKFKYNNNRYVIHRGIIFEEPAIFKTLKRVKSWDQYERYMKDIVSRYERYNKPDGHSGGKGVPGVLVWTYKGNIAFEKNYTYYTGYHSGINRYLPVVVKIGTNFPKFMSKLARDEALYISWIAEKSGLTIENRKPFLYEGNGTAYTAIGLAI